MKIVVQFVWGMVFILMIVGCNDIPDCQLIEDVPYITISFFDRDTTTQSETVIFNEVEANGADTLLIQSDTTNSILLYLNPTDTFTTYYFDTDLGRDTLIMVYKSNIRIESNKCGPVQEFSELDTLYHTFDSLAIENTTLTREGDTNVKIFLD